MLRELDPFWVLVVGLPITLAVAAWALQIACGFCTVDPPKFWHAVMIVFVGGSANIALRYFLPLMGVAQGFATETAAGALSAALVIAVSLPTGPFTALTILVVQGALCGIIYTELAWLTN